MGLLLAWRCRGLVWSTTETEIGLDVGTVWRCRGCFRDLGEVWLVRDMQFVEGCWGSVGVGWVLWVILIQIS